MGLPDKKKAGRSKIVPFIPGEDASDRHARRLHTNLEAEAKVRAWADENGVVLRISNEGHHWIFERPGFFAEWWPSSAKLVIGKKYTQGIHVHDWTQAQKQLARHIRENVQLLRLASIEERAKELLKKAKWLDEECGSDAGSEVANAVEYILRGDKQTCGILHMYDDAKTDKSPEKGLLN